MTRALSPKGGFLHLPRAHQEWGDSSEVPTSLIEQVGVGGCSLLWICATGILNRLCKCFSFNPSELSSFNHIWDQSSWLWNEQGTARAFPCASWSAVGEEGTGCGNLCQGVMLFRFFFKYSVVTWKTQVLLSLSMCFLWLFLYVSASQRYRSTYPYHGSLAGKLLFKERAALSLSLWDLYSLPFSFLFLKSDI